MRLLPIRLGRSLLLVGLLFLSGCPQPTAECSGCSSTEFCCLGVCTPLGASCGGTDAGPNDAPLSDGAADGAMADAPNRCAPPASATSVATVCVGDTRTSCTDDDERSCLVSDRVCIDWIDESGVAHASCVIESESEPCDPATDVARCDGRSIRTCLARGTGPPGEPQPAGFAHRIDCGEHASDATCQLAGTRPVCFSPTDVSCDPDTHAQTCAEYCQIAPYTELPGVLRPYPCAASERCVLNEWSFDRPACVPTSATASPGANTDLGCVSGSAIHVRRYGYEFDEPCSDRVIGDTARCFDAPPDDVPAQCIGARTETCDPSSYAPLCDTENTSRYCTSSWVVSTMRCPTIEGSLLSPGPCDAASGLCVVGAPCDPATFEPYCASPFYRVTCPSGVTVSFGPFACS